MKKLKQSMWNLLTEFTQADMEVTEVMGSTSPLDTLSWGAEGTANVHGSRSQSANVGGVT